MPGRIEIHYCVKCKWMFRASWICQELLSTFERDDVISEVALKPSVEVSGVFDIYVDEKLIWCRKAEGRFPEAKEVKQRVRDLLVPERDLGHSDSKKTEGVGLAASASKRPKSSPERGSVEGQPAPVEQAPTMFTELDNGRPAPPEPASATVSTSLKL
mmetsp:Transcript_70518/g.210278  ORF Transcript_70518/g.210278 Transcript_70518/m.210278 type:complete len:158 (-) Transcript_70518:59-532(-)